MTVLEQRWNRIVKAETLNENRLVKTPRADTAFVHWQVRNRRDYSENEILALIESA